MRINKPQKPHRPLKKGDVNSAEQGIATQINQFMLDLAAQPGLDLNTKRPIIQKVFNILQTRLKSEPAGLDVKKNRTRMTGQGAGTTLKSAAVAAAKPQVQTEGCGDPQLPSRTTIPTNE